MYKVRPDLRKGKEAQSSLFYGISEKELRERFVAATSNAYRTGAPGRDWFWVLRSFETDLGLQLQSTSIMRDWAGGDPNVLQLFRLAGTSSVAKKHVKRFYELESKQLLKKKKLVLDMETATLLARFRGSCSPKYQKRNAEVYEHIAPLLVDAFRRANRKHRGGYEFLVELRDRNCLSDRDYRKLAGPEVKRLQKLMANMTPAELVRAVYFLIHGGYFESIEPLTVVRVAEGQGIDGNWGPPENRNGPTTPLYGAYVWATILSRGGSPITFTEFKAAQTAEGGVEEARRAP